MIEFIKWCFRDENSGAATVLILILAGYFVLQLVNIIVNRKKK